LGFTFEQVENAESYSIDKLYTEIKKVLGEEYKDIPLIEAEGVNTKEDIEKYIKMGFAGVQIGTRFICTEESGMERAGQQVVIDATNDDVVVIKSPVGLPARVLRTPLVDRVLAGEHEVFSCPYKCLITCDMKTVPFCIAQALLAARAGDYNNGLFMTGANVDAVKDVIPVDQFFKSLE